jgi:hypothetical protein
MSTRKIGFILTPLGLLAVLIPLLLDFVGAGDRGIGASQILGMEIGVVLLLVGLPMSFLYEDRNLDVWRSFRLGLDRLLSLPVGVWVLAGFLIVFVLLFLFPVFFNSERSMWYFRNFLPDRSPIGLDVRAVMDYVRDWLVSGESPYADRFIAYPPLALVLFAPMLLIEYPTFYFVIVFLTVSIYSLAALVMAVSLPEKRNSFLLPVLFILSLFSYGFQFELERGQFNLIAFSLCLIAIFLFHANDGYRLPAYLLFTLGVQLKIYPVILIVMFIKDWRDWKANLKRLAGIALLNFLLLFIAGFGMFTGFLGAVGSQQLFQSSWNGNHSLKGFVNQLSHDGFGWFESGELAMLSQWQGSIELFLLVMLAVCLISLMAHSYFSGRPGFNPYLLVACTVCALVIPSISNDYKLPILTLPMAALWSTITLPEQPFRRIMSILLILVSSVTYWSVQYPFIVKPAYLSRNFLTLFILLLTVTALRIVTSSRDPSASLAKAREQTKSVLPAE